MKKNKFIKILIWVFCSAIVLLLLTIVTCHFIVVGNASGRTYNDVDSIPHNHYGLLLATSPITPGGAHNFYFDNRIKAADELYKAGKIDYIIASGGDYTKEHKNGCDEPAAIRDSLVARGIPVDRIILDYEGLRTLNSIVKAKEIYGLDSVTLISQRYHNERAIYLADHYNLHTVGYNAEPSPIRRNRIKNTLREYLARVKMFIDFIYRQTPHFDSDNANKLSQETINPKTRTLLALFYGMEHNSGQYYDLVLDSIPGLLHREYEALWCNHVDSIKFNMSIGIYMDSVYPSEPVRKYLFKKIDSAVKEGFAYDVSDDDLYLLAKGPSSQTTAIAYLDKWGHIFQQLTSKKRYDDSCSIYPYVVGSRGCTVCHKIYEDSLCVTYILEESVDYHSSCGCPSSADYITLCKQTGKVMGVSDIVTVETKDKIANSLYLEYCKEAATKGFTPGDITGEYLIEKANGIALVNEGILFFFHPYNIGCGAEGQYNLIINTESH